jgi:hypothetical protein
MKFKGPLIPIIAEFRGDLPLDQYIASQELRSFANLSVEYCCVSLMNKEAMQMAGTLVTFAHGIFSQFCLYCNFAIIADWDRLDILTKVLVTLILFYKHNFNPVILGNVRILVPYDTNVVGSFT